MMLLALLLAGQVPVPASPPPRDVVVQALRKLRLATELKDGRVAHCEVRVSSGDAGVDGAACEATTACVAQGFDQSEPLADCVDARLTAYVRARAAEDAGS